MPCIFNMDNNTVSIIEHLSFVNPESSNIEDKENRSFHVNYTPKTPQGFDHEATFRGGALRDGEAPQLLSREALGLFAQYAAVGLVYGTLPHTIVPFLTYYLNMEGTATTSARALLSIPWALKVFVGIISDNFPIYGYRRRPYMILGWLICIMSLFVLAMLPIGDPYFLDPQDRHIKPEDYEKFGVVMRLNEDAPSHGGKFILFMMFASFGYLIADVAADAVVVEYAQREPESIRGRMQTAIYTVRTTFGIVSQLLLMFGLNSHNYGGSFTFGVSFSTIMLILAVFCIPVVPMTWNFVAEAKYYCCETHTIYAYLQKLWQTLQTQAFYQVIAYSFLSGVFSSVAYVAYEPITSYWVHASAFSLGWSSIVGNFVLVGTLVWTGRAGLHWNWRVMIAVTTVAVVIIDAFCTMLVTHDVIREPWFWVGVPIIEQLPYGVQFIVSTYVVVELAGEGNEGACYGLLTTVANLGQPFALTITKNLNAPFAVWNDDILADTTEVRRDVTLTILMSYVFKLFSLVFLLWLPAQKAQAQELKAKGKSSRFMGLLTIGYCLFALIWSVTTNLLAIFESTKCLWITGGCHN